MSFYKHITTNKWFLLAWYIYRVDFNNSDKQSSIIYQFTTTKLVNLKHKKYEESLSS